MSELDKLQTFMATALQGRKALARSPEAVAFANAHIAGNSELSPVEQLEIYREQFWLRHTSSLVEDYPGLSGIIGQKVWERLVEEYLAEHPPTSFSLRDLGFALPEFVERATFLPHHELCLDMARLERNHLEVFDCADPAPLDPARLATIPEQAWETAVLVLSPTLRLLRVHYPVLELWRTLRNLGDDPVPIPEPDPQNLVIYRSELRILHKQVSEGAFALLEELRAAVPLVPACAAAQARVPAESAQIEAHIADWFQDFAARGWISDVRLPVFQDCSTRS